MKGITKQPYKSDVFTVKQYGHIAKISYCKVVREAGWEEMETKAKKGTKNTEKLSNNLARAKSIVQELALCNPWDWWCTFTLNASKKDRFDLDSFVRDFGEFLHNYNRRCPDEHKVKYLLVPEQHKNGAWHMHGFIKGIKPEDIMKNEHGYLTWTKYNEKFGFISIERIKDIDRMASYILKYITKDISKGVGKLNKHSYYSSKGLERAEELYRGSGELLTDWDWEHPDGYCKIKNVDLRTDSIYNHLEMYNYDFE